MTNIRRIQNSVKPLRMPSQKLDLQEQDIKEEDSRRFLVKSEALSHWVKEKK